MKTKVLIISICLFLLFLQSCYSQPIATHMQLPTNTNSQTFTPTKNYTFTPYPRLSSIDLTQTAFYPTFIAFNQTQEHYMFTSVPSTLEARNAKCEDGFAIELLLDVVRMSNDEWIVFTCSPIPTNKKDIWTPGVVDYGTRYTQIIKADLSKTWTIQHNEFDYSIIDRPDAFIAPYRWTADGKYLYFYPKYYPGLDGGNTTTIFHTFINDLYRINLQTGEFELVLQTKDFDALSISPNDQFLVYSQWDEPNIIYVRNLQNGDNAKVTLNEDIIASGHFTWSPDSESVVFVTPHGIRNLPTVDDTSSTSIFVLTLKNMRVQKILSEDTRIFAISDDCNKDKKGVWINQNTICLYTLNNEHEDWNSYFSINIKTGLISYIRPFLDPTPTVTPTP